MFWNKKRKEEEEERRSRSLENTLAIALPASAALASVTYATLQNMTKKKRGSSTIPYDIKEKRFSELSPLGQKIVQQIGGLESMSEGKFRAVARAQRAGEDFHGIIPIIKKLPPEEQQRIMQYITRHGIKNVINSFQTKYKNAVLSILLNDDEDMQKLAMAELNQEQFNYDPS